MKSVLKYLVPVDDEWHDVRIPAGATFVYAAQQTSDQVSLWYEVPTAGSAYEYFRIRRLRVFATGQPIADDLSWFATAVGPVFVWHVYQDGDPR